jgi:hypothetical protein
VIVKINDKVVVDYSEPAGVLPGRNKLDCGSFALQAHDAKSVTYYRNLRAKPLPDVPSEQHKPKNRVKAQASK